MSDEDVRNPPPKRREPAKFEPPPWERDQFEKIAQTTGRSEPVADQETVEQDAGVGGGGLNATSEASPASGVTASAGESDTKAEQQVDEKQLALMLMGLRAEEPRPEEAFWKVTTIAGVVCALIGLVITTWAIVAFATLSKSGAQGLTLASVLMLFGLGFAGGGVWLVAKTLRQQGVL